jgi:hypothetical protein
MDYKKLKELLYDHCLNYAESRLNAIKDAMLSARESANDDSKSSAGDKHETGRSMAQLEQEKLSAQLQEAEKLLNSIKQIERGKISSTISSGALVQTDKGNYFISISAGKFVINSEEYIAVSPASPFGALLLQQNGKTAFNFNNASYRIKKVS